MSFGQLIFLSDNITEVIINEGVEVSLDDVAEYHKSLVKRHGGNGFGLLVNRVHQFSYSFDAQIHIGHLPNLRAVAMISSFGEPAVESMREIKRSKFPIESFCDYQEGLRWLKLAMQNSGI